MALLKAFADASGNQYTPAYWTGVQLNIGSADETINLVFYAYRDAPSYLAGKAPLNGGVKQYTISGAEFAAVAASAPSGATLEAALANAVESYALAKLDTPSGQLDGSGKPVLISFFDGATQV